METEVLYLVPIVAGVVQVTRKVGLPARFAPVVALAVGVAFGFPDVLAGCVIGLSASGLYSGAKATAKK